MKTIIHIDPAEPRPIYIQIMDEIRRGIVVGTLREGDALPPVRQLAATLRVNPNTVKQAYQLLERDGLLYARRGQGTFVARVSVDDSERRSLARTVARRAMRDAFRHGVGIEDLVATLRELASDDHPEGSDT